MKNMRWIVLPLFLVSFACGCGSDMETEVYVPENTDEAISPTTELEDTLESPPPPPIPEGRL